MFDPLEHPGIPVGHRRRHWREFDVEPVDPRATDPYTRCRIRMGAVVEATAELFDRQFADHVRGADEHRVVSRLGDAAAERRRHATAARAVPRSAVEEAMDREWAAFDLAGWAARNECEPDRSTAYRQEAWQHLERLHRYTGFGARARLPGADQIADEVQGLSLPPVVTAPADSRPPSAPVTQPLSLLHDWMMHAAGRSAAGFRAGSSDAGWAALVVNESANCYLYYGFLAEEDDRRLRPVWELQLQMRLTRLHAASDLLRRYGGRDPQEVIGEGLPEPLSLRTDRSSLPADEPDALRPPDRDQDRKGPDVLELLTGHHDRMKRLCGRAARSARDDAYVAFGELARLITLHEIAEEQMLHPLVRRLRPDDQLVDHLLDEESRISDALSDAVRAAAHGHLDDTIGGLREMVTAHARCEEHHEFPQLRSSVPVPERREMGRAVRAAEAADAEAGPPDPEPVGPRALAQTVERVRDAFAGR